MENEVLKQEIEEMKRIKESLKSDIIELDEYEDVSSTSVKEEIKVGNFKHIPQGAIMTVMEILEKKQ